MARSANAICSAAYSMVGLRFVPRKQLETELVERS